MREVVLLFDEAAGIPTPIWNVSRGFFTEVGPYRAHMAASQMRKLEMESESFQAEKRAQATPLRVDKLAKDKLQMRPATPAITQYVTHRETAAATPPAKP